ncbi:MAG: phenylacetate--CoA ligase [Firmicutes bacterium]|nr:phenylacetate--CoA ligase [Bacillota bacterium]
MYLEKEAECMERTELQELQRERLKGIIKHAYENVPFYHRRFDEAGLSADDVKNVEDISKFPFTLKSDLRDNYPFGLFAVPRSEVVRVHASSGTTGKPTVVGYTAKDIDNWATMIARCLVMAGGTPESMVQVAYGYGLFTGGLGLHYGVEKLGATVVPASGGNTPRQIMLMLDFGVDILACTPSYAMYLAEAIEEMGAKQDLKLKAGIFGAEPWSNQMRISMEEKLNFRAHDIYGLSEIMGPGVGMECSCQKGLHIFEDHFLAEVIDPETGQVLPYGEKGELVLTTLTKEALPMIRYRTRDIAVLNPEVCACGRTHVRMEKVLGRTDDMIIVRGVNVFPSQVETILLRSQYVAPFYQLVVDRRGTMDELEVHVEVTEETLKSAEIRRLEEIRNRINRDLESSLGIAVRVKLVEPKSIERSEGKAKRVVDRRTL